GTGNNRPVPQPVPNFHFPNDQAITAGNPRAVQVAYGGVPPGVINADAIFEQDVNTGQITWNAPVAVGYYNVAFEVEEYRRVALGHQHRLIGRVIRDMQIIVTASTNLRPIITIPQDICVVAGARITGAVTAVDAGTPSSPQSPVTLFAYSGIIP